MSKRENAAKIKKGLYESNAFRFMPREGYVNPVHL